MHEGPSVQPALAEVKQAIERLPREERAMLRPWILARFDVRGYPVHGYVDAGDRGESRQIERAKVPPPKA